MCSHNSYFVIKKNDLRNCYIVKNTHTHTHTQRYLPLDEIASIKEFQMK